MRFQLGPQAGLVFATALAAGSISASLNVPSGVDTGAGGAALEPLSPKALIEAPRPGTGLASPEGTSALIGTSEYSFSSKSTSKVVYHVPIPSHGSAASFITTQPTELVRNTTSAVFLSEDEAAYVIGNTLYAKSTKKPDADDKGTKAGEFPAPVDNLVAVGAGEEGVTLVFSAEVYDDGVLENMPKHDKSEVEEEWSRVKAYDTTFVRHWDTWINPRKRSQLFSVDIKRSGKKDAQSSSSSSFEFSSGFRNLMHGEHLETPVPPFGGAEDFAVNERFVAFTAKDPKLNPAWHTKQNIYLVPLKGGEKPRKLTSGTHGWAGAPAFSPDGEYIAWLQMEKDGLESDRRVVQIYSLNTNKQTALVHKWDSSPSSVSFSPDGQALYLISEDDAQDKVFTISLKHDENGQIYSPDSEPAVLLDEGGTGSLQPLKDGRLLLTASSMTSLNDLYLLSPNKAVKGKHATERLTQFAARSNALSRVDFGPEPEKLTWTGAEGKEVHGWIIRPPKWDADKTYPLAVLIHGGPEGAWTNSWSTRWNPMVFAAQGFVVFTPNPTGSTGYGQAFTDGIQNHWGGRPYKDIISGVRYVLDIERSADPERVVAAGASYGGYMINWLQGHNNEGLFKGFVCHDGVFNTLNTFYSTEELYFPEAEFGGIPWEHRAVYQQWSPEQHTANWNTPQLVIHGGKDYRLTESEGLSAFNTLQRRGVESKLLYFPDENHWVLDPRNSLRWHEEVLGWLQKWSAAPKKEGSKEDTTPLVFQNAKL